MHRINGFSCNKQRSEYKALPAVVTAIICANDTKMHSQSSTQYDSDVRRSYHTVWHTQKQFNG